MGSQYSPTDDQIVENRHVTLLELLDRIVDKGVMVKGEILLSVADIELIYLNLGLLLASVKTVVHAARIDNGRQVERPSFPGEFLNEQYRETGSKDIAPQPLPREQDSTEHDSGKTIARTLPSDIDSRRKRHIGQKANIDPKNVEKGLVQLVLTLVDLIRQLMEKQAIRRIEDEQLDASEIERVGNAFFLLNEKIEELKKTFDLTDEDLNLDLGPLGDLL
jgi:hypothetical protein